MEERYSKDKSAFKLSESWRNFANFTINKA